MTQTTKPYWQCIAPALFCIVLALVYLVLAVIDELARACALPNDSTTSPPRHLSAARRLLNQENP